MRGHDAAATIARHDKDYAAVERELRAATTLAPDTLRTWYALGAFYESQKRWTDAAAVYD